MHFTWTYCQRHSNSALCLGHDVDLLKQTKKEKQLQFSYHYGEVRGLLNVLILQGLIKIKKKEEKEVLPKISKHLSWVKETEKVTNEYCPGIILFSKPICEQFVGYIMIHGRHGQKSLHHPVFGHLICLPILPSDCNTFCCKLVMRNQC